MPSSGPSHPPEFPCECIELGPCERASVETRSIQAAVVSPVLGRATALLVAGLLLATLGLPVADAEEVEAGPGEPVLRTAARIARVWARPGPSREGDGVVAWPLAERLEVGFDAVRSEDAGSASTWRRSPLTPGLVFRATNDGDGGIAPASGLRDLLVAGAPAQEGQVAWLVSRRPGSGGVVTTRALRAWSMERGGGHVIALQVDHPMPAGLGVVVQESGAAVGIAVFPGRGEKPFGLAYGRNLLERATEPLSEAAGATEARDAEGRLYAVEGSAAAAWPDGARAALPFLLKALARLPRDHPWFVDLASDLARCLIVERPIDEALKAFRALREKSQADPQIELLHAGLLARAGQFAQAETLLGSLMAYPLVEWEARLGLLKTVLMKPVLAPAVPQGVLPLPRSPCPRCVAGDLGACLVLVGEFDLAVPRLQQVLGTPDAKAVHLWAMAQIHHRAGRLEAAREALEACVAAPHPEPTWYGDLGGVLCEIGRDWPEAAWAFDVAISGTGPSSDYVLGRAFARGMGGDYAGARTDLRSSLQDSPGDAEAWQLLGELAVRHNAREDLLEALEALQGLDEPGARRLRQLAMKKGLLQR